MSNNQIERISATSEKPQKGSRSHSLAHTGEQTSRPLPFAPGAVLVTLAAFLVYAVPLTFVGQVPPTALMAITIVSVGVATAITFWLRRELFLVFWIGLALIQNFAVGLLVPAHISGIPIYVSESKTIALSIAILLMLPAAAKNLQKYRRLVGWYLIYAVCILLQALAVQSGTIAYLRNFLLPLAAAILILAITAEWERAQRVVLLVRIVQYATVLLVVGALTEIALGSERWRQLVNADKNSALNSLSTVTSLFGVRLERVGGVLVEPTNAGYVAAGLIVIAGILLIDKKQANRASLAVAILLDLLVLVASGAKSGFLMLFIATLAAVVYAVTRRSTLGLLASWAAAFMTVYLYIIFVKGPPAAVAMFAQPLSIVGGGESTTYHMAGLVSGIKFAFSNILGAGIGTGGNFALGTGEPIKRFLVTGGESSWGVLAYQGGLLGIALFLIVVAKMCGELGRRSAILLAAWSSAAMFAEALFGPQSAGVIMVATALLAAERSKADLDVCANDKTVSLKKLVTPDA